MVSCDSVLWNGSTYNISGVYNHVTTNAVGCDSTATLILNITGIPGGQIVSNGLNIEINVTGGSGPYLYNWNIGSTAQFITPQSNGWYWCVVTDANGCISDTSFFEVNFLPNSINLTGVNNLNIYPNPTEGIVHVNFSVDNIQNIKLQIVNSIGEIVYIEYLDSFMGGFVKTIDLSKYSKGVYILQIKSNKGNLSKKITLQ